MTRKSILYSIAIVCTMILAACSDGEPDNRIYPDEPQTPFQVTDRKGILMHEEPKNEWKIWAYPVIDRPMADTTYIIEQMPKDFQPQPYNDVIFSGEALYLYAIHYISGGIMHYCSLNISEITHETDIQTGTANNKMMGCGTPAPEPPLWFFD